MTGSMLALLIGFCLDLLYGDPHWMPHPIRVIGNNIDRVEKLLRKKNDSAKKQKEKGIALLAIISLGTLLFYAILKIVTYRYNFWLGVIIESLVIYQMLAIKCLKDETMRVYNALEEKDLLSARKWISYLVTRKTDEMTEEDIVKAAVETISENIVDGITSPLFFVALGGAPLGMFYKAVNTLDSMVGYRNDKYEHFGWASAKMDDVLNYVPARLTGLIIVFVAYVFGYNGKNALKILKRDKKNHSSPNSPYSEAPVAGALSIQLGGRATYFGVTKDKPTMGDPIKPIERKHIKQTNKIMVETSSVTIILILLLQYYI